MRERGAPVRCTLSKVAKGELEKTAAELGYSTVEDLYAALGYGKYSAAQILQKAAATQSFEQPEAGKCKPAPTATTTPLFVPPPEHDAVIRVKGHGRPAGVSGQVLQSHSRGKHRGYVTRGKGVAVHSRLCPNVESLIYDAERKIEVELARNASDWFPVRVAVHTDDWPGMLNQLTSVLSNENTNIGRLEAKTEEDLDALVDLTVDVRDKRQLEKILTAMRGIAGVPRRTPLR